MRAGSGFGMSVDLGHCATLGEVETTLQGVRLSFPDAAENTEKPVGKGAEDRKSALSRFRCQTCRALSRSVQNLSEVAPDVGAQLWMLKGEVDGGLEVTDLVSGIEAASLELVSVEPTFLSQTIKGVG